MNTIRYFSTNEGIFGAPDLERRIADGSLKTVGLAEAAIKGLAHDSGLYMPTHFPTIDIKTIEEMRGMPYHQIFVVVLKDFFKDVLSEATLERIAREAFDFEPYIEKIRNSNNINVRMDEGPTASFKDFRARPLFPLIEALVKLSSLTA